MINITEYAVLDLLINSFFYGFQIQRYEGASTIFGPYTLPIYLQQYEKLAAALEVGPSSKLENISFKDI